MADIVVDGNTKVTYVATLVNPAAPTATALNAGMDLQSRLVATGLEGFDASDAEVDNTSLASTVDTKLPGRPQYSNTALVMKKRAVGDTDTEFDTLTERGTTGYICIRDGQPEGDDWAAADLGAVYPIFTGSFSWVGRGEANSVLRFRVPATVSDQVFLKAVVA